MANENAQIKELTYSSTTDFETATTGVTDPIMAWITTDPQQIGVKILGNYTYYENPAAALAALQASVATNTASITTLFGIVASGAAPGTPTINGALCAPYGESFRPETLTANPMPTLFIPYGEERDLLDYHVDTVLISTAYPQMGLTGATRLTLADDSGNVLVTIENGDEGGYDLIGSAVIPSDDPGVHPIMYDASPDIVLAYIITDHLGLNPAAVISTFIEVRDSRFSINRGSLSQPLQAQPFKFSAWLFEFAHIVNATDMWDFAVSLKLAGVALTDSDIAVATGATTSGDMVLKTRILVEYLGVTFTGGEGYPHHFRITPQFIIDGAAISSPNPVPLEREVSNNDFPTDDATQMWFEVDFTPNPTDMTRFDLISSRVTSIPPGAISG